VAYISQSDRALRRAAARRRVRRRRAVAFAALAVLLAVVAALALGSKSGSGAHPTTGASLSGGSVAGPSGSAGVAAVGSAGGSVSRLPPVERAIPGVAHVIVRGPARPEIALTFDDGFCAPCVARIIRTLAATGAHATIFPNGTYSRSWVPQASTIRRLVAKGQLQVGNHTFLHHDALLESPAAFLTDLSRDESWIERTFGVTARPFFRPPYGAYNSTTLTTAGASGYTKVIIWSGTVADSSPRTVGYILGAIRHWARPGAIILMHGNYRATSIALTQIIQIVRARGLEPVTLAQLLR
jgi:peptidoglycan/xylan/chitin deacetylase (PgdA/CDA1 family)